MTLSEPLMPDDGSAPMADGDPGFSGSPEDLLTAAEVAALLRVTTGWVYAETRRHRIPHIRLGRYVRYRREALHSWMRQIESSVLPGRRAPRNR
jgi:excisionase family DNA binding protein